VVDPDLDVVAICELKGDPSPGHGSAENVNGRIG
jgi:hypothetical protein